MHKGIVGPKLSVGQRIGLDQCFLQHRVFAYPTEAVYGLGCDPWDQQAVESLLMMKARDWRKGLIVVAATWASLTPLLQPLSVDVVARVQATWPGPNTWLLPAAQHVPDWVVGQHSTLAVRVSDHPVVQGICQRYGPIISTSANPSTRQPAKTALQVRCYFNRSLGYVVHGALGHLKRPTPIRDGLTGAYIRD